MGRRPARFTLITAFLRGFCAATDAPGYEEFFKAALGKVYIYRLIMAALRTQKIAPNAVGFRGIMNGCDVTSKESASP